MIDASSEEGEEYQSLAAWVVREALSRMPREYSMHVTDISLIENLYVIILYNCRINVKRIDWEYVIITMLPPTAFMRLILVPSCNPNMVVTHC